MIAWVLLIIMLLAFPFLLPEVCLPWSRKTRERIRARVRQRLTPPQWEQVKDAFPED